MIKNGQDSLFEDVHLIFYKQVRGFIIKLYRKRDIQAEKYLTIKQMNFKTPKTSKMPSKESSSPRKTTQKSTLISKQSPSTYRSKTLEQQSAQSSLIIKLIQAQISTQDEYQNLLIKNKQLEIKILQLQQQGQSLKKSYKKASKPLEQVKSKIESARLSLIEKQKYLEKFYVHLDNKLKSNVHSNLFGKLQKIQAALEQKYQQQKQTLYSGLASQHENMEVANQKLARLKQYRDQLIKQYTQRAMDSSNRPMSRQQSQFNKQVDSRSNRHGSDKKSTKQKSQKRSVYNTSSKKSYQQKLSLKNKEKEKELIKNREQQERRNRKEQKRLAKVQARNECERLRQNIIKLKKQKEMAQKDEKLLKLLLNIEQEHKKHSTYIINGYKKMFTIQYRQMLSSRKKSPTTSRQPSPDNFKKSQANNSLNQSQKSELHQSVASMPDVQGMQKMLSQKQAQRQVLQRQLQERNAALERCKERFTEDVGEYSRLQEQIMRISNRNLGGSYREPNHRMTYVESQNVANHRSTYTSYQQRSDQMDEDL